MIFTQFRSVLTFSSKIHLLSDSVANPVLVFSLKSSDHYGEIKGHVIHVPLLPSGTVYGIRQPSERSTHYQSFCKDSLRWHRQAVLICCTLHSAIPSRQHRHIQSIATDKATCTIQLSAFYLMHTCHGLFMCLV